MSDRPRVDIEVTGNSGTVEISHDPEAFDLFVTVEGSPPIVPRTRWEAFKDGWRIAGERERPRRAALVRPAPSSSVWPWLAALWLLR
jgi:hypothetical protein